ncbi:hypothetical protein C8J57DRAFT_1220444 [Mycena rebaudengoi]|nr:hypothetical protein C8J57DRAFT_1220444 [Mycena rebaudengoi]
MFTGILNTLGKRGGGGRSRRLPLVPSPPFPPQENFEKSNGDPQVQRYPMAYSWNPGRYFSERTWFHDRQKGSGTFTNSTNIFPGKAKFITVQLTKILDELARCMDTASSKPPFTLQPMIGNAPHANVNKHGLQHRSSKEERMPYFQGHYPERLIANQNEDHKPPLTMRKLQSPGGEGWG